MTTNCYFVTTKCYYIQIVVTNSHKSDKFKSISGGTVNLTFILFNLFKCEIFQRSADLLTCENVAYATDPALSLSTVCQMLNLRW